MALAGVQVASLAAGVPQSITRPGDITRHRHGRRAYVQTSPGHICPCKVVAPPPRRRLTTRRPTSCSDNSLEWTGDWEGRAVPGAKDLDRLFRRRFDNEGEEREWNDCGIQDQETAGFGKAKVKELPVFRTEWCHLPYQEDLLHIFMPHCVHMFEEILARPRPWLYAHSFIGGAKGSSDDLTVHSTAATLMEIMEVERFSDGRLLLVVEGRQKVRLHKLVQKLPYVTAETRSGMMAMDVEQRMVETAVTAAMLASRAGREDAANPAGARDGDDRAATGENCGGTLRDLLHGPLAFHMERLLAKERAAWQLYNKVRAMEARLRLDRKMQPPASALANLVPPYAYLDREDHTQLASLSPPDRPDFSCAANDMAGQRESASDPSSQRAAVGWHPSEAQLLLSRTQRLSYLLVAAVPKRIPRGAGQHYILKERSIVRRLDAIMEMLDERYHELVAKVCVVKAFRRDEDGSA
eukprot:jgi/Mesvir1/7193/Mv19021-RA.1